MKVKSNQKDTSDTKECDDCLCDCCSHRPIVNLTFNITLRLPENQVQANQVQAKQQEETNIQSVEVKPVIVEGKMGLWDLIKAHPDKEWNWYTISRNASITFDITFNIIQANI